MRLVVLKWRLKDIKNGFIFICIWLSVQQTLISIFDYCLSVLCHKSFLKYFDKKRFIYQLLLRQFQYLKYKDKSQSCSFCKLNLNLWGSTRKLITNSELSKRAQNRGFVRFLNTMILHLDTEVCNVMKRKYIKHYF